MEPDQKTSKKLGKAKQKDVKTKRKQSTKTTNDTTEQNEPNEDSTETNNTNEGSTEEDQNQENNIQQSMLIA